VITHPFPTDRKADCCRMFTDGQDGVQFIFSHVATGQEISVIRSTYSMGSSDGLWEIACSNSYTGLFHDSVQGYLSEEQVVAQIDSYFAEWDAESNAD